jgi:L-malate glycosyltransferase
MTTQNETLMPQGDWDSGYTNTPLQIAAVHHPITALIRRHFAPVTSQSVYEVGCFPGSFLAVFGELGYTLHGIDQTPRLPEMTAFLTRSGYTVGTVKDGDFFAETPTPTYDVVCSFGFIEHFTDVSAVIAQHLALVKPGGYVLLTTPNFAGLWQRIAHSLVDLANLKKHNLAAMNPRAWAAQCEAAGFTILEAGYVGRCDFWSEPHHRDRVETLLWYAVRAAVYLLKRIVWFDSRGLSPFCVLVAHKLPYADRPD